MKKRNLFYYIVLALSGAGLLFALGRGLTWAAWNDPSPWLTRIAIWIGLAVAAAAAFFFAGRLRRLTERIPRRTQSVIYAVGLVLILLAGLVLRLIVIQGVPITPASDFETYFKLGEHLTNGTLLSQGENYRDYAAAFPHTMGFPMLVLWPVFSLFKVSLDTALYANLVFCLGNILLTAIIARMLAGRMCGLLAGALMAVWPSHVLYSALVASEPSYTFLLLLCVLIACTLFQRGPLCFSGRHPLGAVLLYVTLGILLALADAIRPVAKILLIALLLLTAFHRDKEEAPKIGASRQVIARGWLCGLIVLAGYVLSGTLMMYEVQAQIQKPVVSGLNASGYNLMVGLNTESSGTWNAADSAFFSQVKVEKGVTAAHQAAMRVGLSRIKEDPLGILNLAVMKFANLWQGDDFGGEWVVLFGGQQGTLTDGWAKGLKVIRLIGRLLYLAVLLFSFLHLARISLDPRREYLLMLLFFLGTAALHMALETQVRYHYSVIPIFILLAAPALLNPWPFPLAKDRNRKASL